MDADKGRRMLVCNTVERLAGLSRVWAGFVVGLAFTMYAGAEPKLIPKASSSSQIAIDGLSIPYQVSWAPLVLRNAAGAPQASVSAVSYVRSDTAAEANRPVLFAWHGGPGAASISLGFDLLGPKRFVHSGGSEGFTGRSEPDLRDLADDPGTLLDVADIVLIDPVGTGLSRELTKGGGKPYWNVHGDARAVESLIRAWLREHKRTGAPVFLLGESYGGFRLGALAAHIGDLHIAGLIFLSPGLNLRMQAGDLSTISSDPSWIGGIDDDQAFVVNLPTMAVTALFHKRIEPTGRSVEQVYAEARDFAQGKYSSALLQGAALSPAASNEVANELSRLIGLPVGEIAASNLRVQSQQFLETLVPDSVVGRVDTRVVAPVRKTPSVPGRIKSADDPALNMAGRNVMHSKWASEYLREVVGVKTDQPYVGLDLNVNFGWDWGIGSSKLEDNIVGLDVVPDIAALMRAKTTSRLLLVSAYYDLAVPALAQQEAVLHAGIPLNRITQLIFETGHTISQDDQSRKRLQGELHRFVRQALGN